jgi:hypothetical protein
MVMALPLASMARSITLPLTNKACELGKSLTIFGGRPISRAFLKSADSSDILILPAEKLNILNNYRRLVRHELVYKNNMIAVKIIRLKDDTITEI